MTADRTGMAIPKRFHRVLARGFDPGAESHEWWNQFAQLHPGWELTTWTDPFDPADWELGHLFASCRSGAQLADLVRLEVLWRHGGVYVDADVEPLLSFEPLLRHGFVVGTEDGEWITNAVAAAEPGHPAVRALIDRLLEYAELPDVSPTQTTGPHLWTRVLRGRPDVLVVPPVVFYPVPPPGLARDRHGLGDDIDRHALCIHHWEGSWKDDAAPSKRRPTLKSSARSVAEAVIGWTAPRVREVMKSAQEPEAGGAVHGVPAGDNRLLISTTDSFPLYAVADDASITPALVVDGWYDSRLLNFIDRIIEPGDWFVDVGANIGLFTIAAARRVGRLGRVISYEPDAELAELIDTNRSMNWLENVSVVATAAGDSEGTTTFARHPHFRMLSVAGSDDHAGRGVTDGYEDMTVPIERIDARVPEGAPVRLVKIDVEGGESDVLAGMHDLLARDAVDYIALEVIRDNAASRWGDLIDELRFLEREHNARFGRLRADGSTVAIDLDAIEQRERFAQVIIDLTEHADASATPADA